MIKILNIISMTFTQFFLRKKNEENYNELDNEDNINFYLIFLYTITELVEFLMNNKLCILPKDLKAIIKSNIINLSYNNFQILSYICIKPSRRSIYGQIMNEILDNSIAKPKSDLMMAELHLTKSNPYMLMIQMFHISEKKDLGIDDFIKHYFIVEKKPKQEINFELQMQLPKVKNLWDTIFMSLYNLSNYSNYYKFY